MPNLLVGATLTYSACTTDLQVLGPGGTSGSVVMDAGLDAGLDAGTGCADQTREGFVDVDTFPAIAGCSGGWSVPGLPSPASCNHASGNGSANPAGQGCAASDLCSAGFHLCSSANDVAAHLPAGHACAEVATSGSVFFATLQSGPACQTCSGADGTVCHGNIGNGLSCNTPLTDGAGNPLCTNDLFGCGTIGGPPATGCGVLNEWSGEGCSDLTSDWQCLSSSPTGSFMEFLIVTKSSAAGGGVLCCAN